MVSFDRDGERLGKMREMVISFVVPLVTTRERLETMAQIKWNIPRHLTPLGVYLIWSTTRISLLISDYEHYAAASCPGIVQ